MILLHCYQVERDLLEFSHESFVYARMNQKMPQPFDSMKKIVGLHIEAGRSKDTDPLQLKDMAETQAIDF
jgi:hypothetical protein